MKRTAIFLALVTLLLVLSLVEGPVLSLIEGPVLSLVEGPSFVALAQSGSPYDLTWSTIDGGGATFSTGGDYSLGGTVGQPDAGLLTGGDYTLGSGFWCGGAAAVQYGIYLPLVVRNF